MSVQKIVTWLRHHTEQYRSTMNDTCEAIEDIDKVEKLGEGFSSADPLEEIDIGDGITPRPTFVIKNMSLEHKDSNKVAWELCRLFHLKLL
jgi:cell wall assembly regulator SMI1